VALRRLGDCLGGCLLLEDGFLFHGVSQGGEAGTGGGEGQGTKVVGGSDRVHGSEVPLVQEVEEVVHVELILVLEAHGPAAEREANAGDAPQDLLVGTEDPADFPDIYDRAGTHEEGRGGMDLGQHALEATLEAAGGAFEDAGARDVDLGEGRVRWRKGLLEFGGDVLPHPRCGVAVATALAGLGPPLQVVREDLVDVFRHEHDLDGGGRVAVDLLEALGDVGPGTGAAEVVKVDRMTVAVARVLLDAEAELADDGEDGGVIEIGDGGADAVHGS